ncbi:UvrD-helicase domain-containing protein [Neoroseomonas oryzicola]|uniref:DNA 3'-5' helicase n=1 Tax=Neoroseomonas oryzicola TaxID=535904 RepID=A0A9X9WMV6_9PROT|nr:UvrD-helicase domain-containing protein [Neoroseomonas oryzicola]MBR0661666.1 UvrD-helicase domain-containing protein [Neoroseomonas oryzicola]NKE20167.1 UvrD-helicase domain-containing protein [Neoroseomonas oryzicola]
MTVVSATPPAPTPDAQARHTALTDLGRCLLLQAGAGSGKTSVLAGRVVRMLASGEPPSSIAAISFTELSAAELRERISKFAREALAGSVPQEIEQAFPTGLSAAERENLERACEKLDELACTTIHGFCRLLLTPYPVEAGIDPGAAMLDQAEADLLLEGVCERWLRERLSRAPDATDIFVDVWLKRPDEVANLLDGLVKLMLRHRGATVATCPTPIGAAQVDILRSALGRLQSFRGADFPGWAPDELRDAIDDLVAVMGVLPPPGATEAELLAWGLGLRPPESCATENGFKADPKLKNSKAAWEAARKAAGETKAAGERMVGLVSEALKPVRAAYERVPLLAAERMLHLLAGEATSLVLEYQGEKRRSAALDFGDLLEKAKELLAQHDDVRQALGERYSRVLVDEFQDTDFEQVEVFWRLCGAPPPGNPSAPWETWPLRPGALFLVGDPQQAIYRFRGADLEVFKQVRDIMRAADPEAVVSITRNFRSRPEILTWVNERFEVPLGAPGQCEFQALDAAQATVLSTPGVAAIDFLDGDGASGTRDGEAAAVAEFVANAIGSLDVRDKDGKQTRKCRAGDIALLVPTGTDLWRYERALEERDIQVAAQAGKGFFRRQEVQDLIALTRTIADERDRLALGALLRGPLVGLTDEQLLDAVASLPPGENGHAPMLSLRMELPATADPVLKSRLEILADLAKRKGSMTPHLLLCRAVEEMGVRAVLRQRGGRVAERALANVDLFLEMTRAYEVRGLKAFSDAMRRAWEDGEKELDGRPDADENSVTLITMHSAKGLEWPVVIPVNGGTLLKRDVSMAYDGRTRTIHASVFSLKTDACQLAFDEERRQVEFERQRLWYVATTRARDLLVIPRVPGAATAKNTWWSLITFQLDALPALDRVGPGVLPAPSETLNGQDLATWREEAARIRASIPRFERTIPHLPTESGETVAPPTVLLDPDFPAPPTLARGGLRRGLVMHKLMEEVLTGETPDDQAALASRCAELNAQLPDGLGPEADPAETARLVVATLNLPEVREVRSRLAPEWPVASVSPFDEYENIIMGVADAVVPEEGGPPSLVVDWKSDLDPSEDVVQGYVSQLREYLRATGARAGMLVFMSRGAAVHVDGPPLVGAVAAA